jgi:hypothetical protein
MIAVQKWSVFPAYSKVMLATPNYKNGGVETGVNEYEWVSVCEIQQSSDFFLITKEILVCTEDKYSL